jgi:hypothetical protein
MEELERYLEANQHFLEPAASSSSTSSSSSNPTMRHPYPITKSHQQPNKTLKPPSAAAAVPSRRPPLQVSLNPIRKPLEQSFTIKTKSLHEGSAQYRADLQKMEYEKNIDQFLNIYLEDWRRKRKQRLQRFLEEIKSEQISSFEPTDDGSNKISSRRPPHEATAAVAFGLPRQTKSFSRFLSNVSQQLRALDETCDRYSSQEQRLQVERPSSPPPPPPSLSLPDDHSSSLITPLQSPTRANVLQRELFLEEAYSPPQSVAPIGDSFQGVAPRSLHTSLTLDSPTMESRRENNRFHSATHFLVPGGLSTHHPALSPLSVTATSHTQPPPAPPSHR